MLVGNPHNEPLRLLAIDPGTDTLGIALYHLDLVNRTMTLTDAYTHQASRWIEQQIHHPHWQQREEKYIRLYRHGEHLTGLLYHFQPHWVVHESAFMGKFPKAFQGLVECIYKLHETVRLYDPQLPIEGITPMEVKWALGGSIRKEEVLNSVNNIQDVINLHRLLPTLDEHSVDAVAIGYTKAKQILQYPDWVI